MMKHIQLQHKKYKKYSHITGTLNVLYLNFHTLVSWFISMSSSPTLLRGCELFITLLVSEPVYTTTPKAEPDATTQFAQSVFSTSRLSSLPYPSCCNAWQLQIRNVCMKEKRMKVIMQVDKIWSLYNMKQQNFSRLWRLWTRSLLHVGQSSGSKDVTGW